MEMKHTPGPWRYQPGFLTVFTCSEGKTGVTQAIASPLNGNGAFGLQTVEANARLIAAAPELLEALRSVLSTIKDSDHWWIDEPSHGGFDVALIEAAIAKATGQ